MNFDDEKDLQQILFLAARILLREKILCTPRPQGTTGTKENLFSYASPPFYGRIANRLRGFTLVA